MIGIKEQNELFSLLGERLKKKVTCYVIGGSAMLYYGMKDVTKDIDLVFNDECHRSIYGELPRQVVEYFQATRIGLTATPKDFLKNIDIEKLADDNPR